MSANDSSSAALRAAASAAAYSDAEALLRKRHCGARILVVDDAALNRELLLMLLEPAGLVVEAADDGHQATSMVWWQPHYDAILMDIQMPNLDGLQATREIRQIPGYDRTPIIATTADSSAEARAKCLLAGMDDFLAKPIAPDQLLCALLRWLETRHD